MIKLKWYRLLQMRLGARSFVKEDSYTNSYVLVRGSEAHMLELAKNLLSTGFVEEG